MSDEERFRQIKLSLGKLDDLNIERRKLFTDWATRRIEPEPFASGLKANAAATRAEAERLEAVLG